MNLSNNIVLITGGASGIGYAFAERFIRAGSDVLICGRRRDKLDEAKQKLACPTRVHARVCDVAKEADRIALFEWATHEFPTVNVLVNNAGIQRRVDLQQAESWEQTRQEIAINLEAPIHLSRLFAARFRKRNDTAPPAIINVTSGLAFAPLADVPVYCATKAALRSFTLSLRRQLAGTRVKVIEIIPPAVDTDLQAPGLHTFGAPVNEFAESIFAQLATHDDEEIAYGMAKNASRASREELEQIFVRLNSAAH